MSRTMGLLGVLALLVVFLAPGGLGQGDQAAPGSQLTERDAVCHPEGCYAVFLQKRTFREAGRSCRERGGTLATMHTREAADLLHQLLSEVEPQGARTRIRLWIGLHRPAKQCSSTRALRGFVWVTGDQDGQFTNWLRDDTPGTCAAPRCVAMTVHTSDSGRESSNNYRWLDGSCVLPLDGYVCQYSYKGMCAPLEEEGRGPPVYTTQFHLVSTLLTHVPYGSVASVRCPIDLGNPDARPEQTVLCTERDDATVGWSRDAPLCISGAPQDEDVCNEDHGCEHYCQPTETDYYCYCDEGFILDEDGYGCRPDPLTPTSPPELSSDSAGPTEQTHIKEVCVEMGCEYDCVETLRGLRCTCPPGYQMGPDGRGCLDVDECQQEPCTQVCVNIPGTFHCTCKQGYQTDDEGECVDVDECLDEGTCEGTCENTEGSFVCLCNPGYNLGSGGECVDVDECVGESPCQQQCLNYMGGYQCYCNNGYDLQSDGLTCLLTPDDDEEYSTLTPDPSDFAHIPDLDPVHDNAWSSSFTPDPNFEVETFEVNWQTETPEVPTPDVAHRSDHHLNHLDDMTPMKFQTPPPTTQKGHTGNEINNQAEAKAGGRDASGGSETVKGSSGAKEGSKLEGSTEDAGTTGEVGAGSGKRKHDKSWLLVALLVPLCVFLVVMLALGIVYCTSCAVDKSLSFSNCYRWVLPTTPPDRRNGKPTA